MSAGVTPQTGASARLGTLMAGTAAAAFVDHDAPRSLSEVSTGRTIAIDTVVPGTDIWRIGGGAPLSDEELRDEIRDRVRELARDLSEVSEAG